MSGGTGKSNARRYVKPWLAWDEQLRQIEARGVEVRDRAAARRFLEHVNYYRFSGYALAFETDRHTFRRGTTIEHVQSAYEFDVRLRRLLWSALEVVEVDLRTTIAYCMGEKRGAFGHVWPQSFHHRRNHARFLERLASEVGRSKEAFVLHFRER